MQMDENSKSNSTAPSNHLGSPTHVLDRRHSQQGCTGCGSERSPVCSTLPGKHGNGFLCDVGSRSRHYVKSENAISAIKAHVNAMRDDTWKKAALGAKAQELLRSAGLLDIDLLGLEHPVDGNATQGCDLKAAGKIKRMGRRPTSPMGISEREETGSRNFSVIFDEEGTGHLPYSGGELSKRIRSRNRPMALRVGFLVFEMCDNKQRPLPRSHRHSLTRRRPIGYLVTSRAPSCQKAPKRKERFFRHALYLTGDPEKKLMVRIKQRQSKQYYALSKQVVGVPFNDLVDSICEGRVVEYLVKASELNPCASDVDVWADLVVGRL